MHEPSPSPKPKPAKRPPPSPKVHRAAGASLAPAALERHGGAKEETDPAAGFDLVVAAAAKETSEGSFEEEAGSSQGAVTLPEVTPTLSQEDRGAVATEVEASVVENSEAWDADAARGASTNAALDAEPMPSLPALAASDPSPLPEAALAPEHVVVSEPVVSEPLPPEAAVLSESELPAGGERLASPSPPPPPPPPLMVEAGIEEEEMSTAPGGTGEEAGPALEVVVPRPSAAVTGQVAGLPEGDEEDDAAWGEGGSSPLNSSAADPPLLAEEPPHLVLAPAADEAPADEDGTEGPAASTARPPPPPRTSSLSHGLPAAGHAAGTEGEGKAAPPPPTVKPKPAAPPPKPKPKPT